MCQLPHFNIQASSYVEIIGKKYCRFSCKKKKKIRWQLYKGHTGTCFCTLGAVEFNRPQWEVMKWKNLSTCISPYSEIIDLNSIQCLHYSK